jgi:methionyl-tRNA synthetase
MSEKKFYISTPIYYPSENAHIGHGYCTVLADAISRYKGMRGYKTCFMTGMDEHGQKIAKAAAGSNKTPQQHVDDMAVMWKRLWQSLLISNDVFIRTTEQRHCEGVTEIFKRIYEKEKWRRKFRGR